MESKQAIRSTEQVLYEQQILFVGLRQHANVRVVLKIILLTSFQGTKTTWEDLLKGDRPKCRVTAPPPFTRRSNQPSSLVRVNPSSGVEVETLTPTRPDPREVTTRPLMTADRLKRQVMGQIRNKVRFHCEYDGDESYNHFIHLKINHHQ